MNRKIEIEMKFWNFFFVFLLKGCQRKAMNLSKNEMNDYFPTNKELRQQFNEQNV